MFFFSHKVTDPNVVLWLIMEHGSTIGCEARSRSKYRTTHGVVRILYYLRPRAHSCKSNKGQVN